MVLGIPAVGLTAEATSDETETTVQESVTLDQLLESVKNATAAAEAEVRAREERFINERDRRDELLKDARARRIAAEEEADRLRAAFETGEDELAELETLLDERSGDLREVFTVVHSVAGDTVPVFEGSLVSAQLGDRLSVVEQLADKDVLPTAEGIRSLWLLLLEEINASGKTERFDTTVISASGEEDAQAVTRIGAFTALAGGQYLRYLPESGRLLALARQPVGTQSSDTLAFEQSEEPLLTIPIDPSRGSILALVVQRAGLTERIQQGGVIGYVILVIGLIGIILGAERLVHIGRAQNRQSRELKDESAASEGAVGQMRSVINDPDYLGNVEAISAKMDEIVATAAQKLNRGLPTLAIFAAVSPLLGLLGTVTGMIETFQVITLFGAGDPRLMSGGISQALITTQLGLAVAIPLLLIHSFVQGRANALVAVLDETAANLFAREEIEAVAVSSNVRGEGAAGD
jgi:biopolymer transport protein ExbB